MKKVLFTVLALAALVLVSSCDKKSNENNPFMSEYANEYGIPPFDKITIGENAAYGPTNCAERTAVFKAVSEGVREFKAIVIVGGHERKVESYCPPCGVCRQVLAEFCKPDFLVIIPKSRTEYKVKTLAELLPESFSL